MLLRTPLLLLSALAVTSCSGHSREPVTPLQQTIELEYRFVDAAAPVDARRFAAPQTGEPVALQDEVVLDLRHVVAASAIARRENDHWVMITLTPEGRDRLARSTREHAGQQLGILLDGELIHTPWIRNELQAAHRIPFRTQLSGQEAAALSGRINRAVSLR